MVVIVFTFLFIDMFDTMGTLVGVCTKAGMMKPDGRIHGLNKAFMADAVATVASACCGNIKKLSITMWVLAILFVLKYIFI